MTVTRPTTDRGSDRARRAHADDRRAAAAALVATLPEDHRRALAGALRAPSAHNAQPWRVHPRRVGDGWAYALHYDHHEYLPADPEDRDAYLCMGTFCETLALCAAGLGLRADITLVLERDGADLHVADLVLVPDAAAGDGDPLVPEVGGRRTDRATYRPDPLPATLVAALEALGCVLVPTPAASRVVHEASTASWADRRFVADLRAWVRADSDAPDGMTPRQLGLAGYEWLALRAAFRLGRVLGPLARAYGSREVRLLHDAPAVAVLTADSDDPADLVAAGRRLLRAWVTVCAAGHGYHPISVAIDRPETRPQVAALAGVADGRATPVALFRVGRPTAPAAGSNRVDLVDVVRTL
ncbi:nitroreductase family protein [Phycicoccus flavus]|uniref:Nitroreductase n=1 Tax=Phycicoccus flavus TaxID=2502783 RepID=A0A8T6R5P0_9MICO|nr:hypothetical protein [Phycicoccus flavus]NHA69072.1 hypothetical protein [Phycicoccus flavus]